MAACDSVFSALTELYYKYIFGSKEGQNEPVMLFSPSHVFTLSELEYIFGSKGGQNEPVMLFSPSHVFTLSELGYSRYKPLKWQLCFVQS